MELDGMSIEEARSKLVDVQQRRRQEIENMSRLNNKSTVQLSKTYLNAICYHFMGKNMANEINRARVMAHLLGLPRRFWKQDYMVLEKLSPDEYLTKDDRHIIKSFLAWTPLDRKDRDQKCQTEGLTEAMRPLLLRCNMAKRLNQQNLPNTIKDDHELFTFYKFCYRDGIAEYEADFNASWGKKVIECSYLAPVIEAFSSADDTDDDTPSEQDTSAPDSQSSSESGDEDDTDDASYGESDADGYDSQDSFINDEDSAPSSPIVDGSSSLGWAADRMEGPPAAAQRARPGHRIQPTVTAPRLATEPTADPEEDRPGRESSSAGAGPLAASAAVPAEASGALGLGRGRKRPRDDGGAVSAEAHTPRQGAAAAWRAGSPSPGPGPEVVDLTMDDSDSAPELRGEGGGPAG
jgi:hypothetical protein